MFVNGYVAGQAAARMLAQIAAGQTPPVFAMAARTPDGGVDVEVILDPGAPDPDAMTCVAAVADAETRGLEMPAGVMVSRNYLFVFTGPSLGRAVLVHTFDGTGRLLDRQLGQRDDHRDMSAFIDGFDDGLEAAD